MQKHNLRPRPEPLARVLELRDQDRLPLARSVDYHGEIGSTSDRALELAARDDAELPLLVVAERQTAGRGRGTNRWWSADGALTFSLALPAASDRLLQSQWPQVALVAGLAVCEALETLTPAADLRLKWPNDVFLGGRKLCGILSESVPGWRDRLVVGIGVNVNNAVGRQETGVRGQEPGVRSQESGDGSQQREELERTAVALVDHDGVARELVTVLVAILDQFERRWDELQIAGFASLAEPYRRRCFLTGRTVAVLQPGGQRLTGVARGIDDEGALVLATESGAKRIVAGSIASWQAQGAA